MNYIRDYQSFTPMKAILEDYKNNYPEKENIDLPASEMGVILKEVFPDATRVQRRVNGCRSWLYPVVKSNSNDPQQSHSADVIRWEDLAKFTAELGWQLSDQTDQYFEWMKTQSQDVCNGNRVLQEVKIFKDWTFTVYVNSRKITKETLANLELQSSRKMTRYLFGVLDKYNMCKGFLVPSKQISKDARGNVTGTTEEWCSREAEAVQFHLRSTTCQVLIKDGYKRSSSLLCDSCSRLKRNSSVTCAKEGTKAATKKRESFMSEEELREKLHQEQTRRRNAERRLKYSREKVEQEMKAFGDEDHKEFLHMFRGVELESVGDDMKIFWEVQGQVLTQKNPKGHRWHPK